MGLKITITETGEIVSKEWIPEPVRDDQGNFVLDQDGNIIMDSAPEGVLD